MESSFSVSSAITDAWKTANAHRTLLLKVVLTVVALQLASSIFNVKHVSTSSDVVMVLISLATGIMGTACAIGMLGISLKLVRGEKAEYQEIIPSWHSFWRYVLVSVVSGILFLVGLVLLIIPGIYLMLRFSMAKLAILDHQNIGVFDALRISSEMTSGVKWELLGLFLVIVFINILGVLALIVGLFVTIPISMLAVSHVYVALSKRKKATT